MLLGSSDDALAEAISACSKASAWETAANLSFLLKGFVGLYTTVDGGHLALLKSLKSYEFQ